MNEGCVDHQCRSVLNTLYWTAVVVMSDKQCAITKSHLHLFLSDLVLYIKTWQVAQIIQLLLSPINTKLPALISVLLHNEVNFTHTEMMGMTQLDRVLYSQCGMCVWTDSGRVLNHPHE